MIAGKIEQRICWQTFYKVFKPGSPKVNHGPFVMNLTNIDRLSKCLHCDKDPLTCYKLSLHCTVKYINVKTSVSGALWLVDTLSCWTNEVGASKGVVGNLSLIVLLLISEFRSANKRIFWNVAYRFATLRCKLLLSEYFISHWWCCCKFAALRSIAQKTCEQESLRAMASKPRDAAIIVWDAMVWESAEASVRGCISVSDYLRSNFPLVGFVYDRTYSK